MWWLIGSAPDFWGRGFRFESGIYHNDPDALQDHCELSRKSQGREGNLPLRQKKIKKALKPQKTDIQEGVLPTSGVLPLEHPAREVILLIEQAGCTTATISNQRNSKCTRVQGWSIIYIKKNINPHTLKSPTFSPSSKWTGIVQACAKV